MKSFRLSEKAIEILEKQDNATQYLEELITGKKKAPEKELTEGRVLYLITQELEKVRAELKPQLNKQATVVSKEHIW